MSEIEDLAIEPANAATPLPPATMVVRRSTRSTCRNGATGESEITSTGRLRIARPGTTPRPASSSFRIQKAERLGLTYEEYTLEILERGRHLQIEDVERIAQIKQARAARAARDRS